jgi:tRNA(Ile)-lysidine synthase
LNTTIHIKSDEFADLMQTMSPFEEKPTIAVAVSGGADSMALCLLAHEWAKSNNGKIVAITVDHHLRPSSTDEAKSITKWLNEKNIEHHILDWETPQTQGLEAAARSARYSLLNEFCQQKGILHLMIAHHVDDQAETFLMRIERGSGVYGLSAMSPISYKEHVRYLRPFLSIPRLRLQATCKHFNQEWIEDESNADDKYKRVKFRKLLPSLADTGLNSETIAATAKRMANTREFLEESIASLTAESVFIHPAGFALLNPKKLHSANKEIGQRVLSNIITCIGGNEYPPRFEKTERLYTELCENPDDFKGATLSGCSIKPLPKNAHNCITNLANPNDFSIMICKEFAAIPEKQQLQNRMLWDNRFVLNTNSEPPNAHIGAIGQTGWNMIKQNYDKIPLPKDVIYSLPAIYIKGDMVESPLIGYTSDISRHSNSLIIKSLYFKPIIPISGTYI